MVKTTSVKMNNDIQEKVLQFGRILQQNGIPIDKLIIFGSYAKNTYSKNSDIDVCVVSSKFGRNGVDELQFLFKERGKVDNRIEPYPASLSEYRKTESPVMSEIKKYGYEISKLL